MPPSPKMKLREEWKRKTPPRLTTINFQTSQSHWKRWLYYGILTYLHCQFICPKFLYDNLKQPVQASPITVAATITPIVDIWNADAQPVKQEREFSKQQYSEVFSCLIRDSSLSFQLKWERENCLTLNQRKPHCTMYIFRISRLRKIEAERRRDFLFSSL